MRVGRVKGCGQDARLAIFMEGFNIFNRSDAQTGSNGPFADRVAVV